MIHRYSASGKGAHSLARCTLELDQYPKRCEDLSVPSSRSKYPLHSQYLLHLSLQEPILLFLLLAKIALIGVF